MAPKRNATFTKSFVRRPGRGGGGANDTSIPIRTEAPPPLRQPTRVARAKTLTRPERSQPQVPLLNPPQGVGRNAGRGGHSGPWTVFSHIVTCWAPGFVLSACGMRDKSKRQAWREKVSLVFIALLMGAFVGFVTMGLNVALCPQSQQQLPGQLARIGVGSSAAVGVAGWEFDISKAKLPGQDEVGYNMYTRAGQLSGYDVTPLFTRSAAADFPACSGQQGAYVTSDTCATANGLPKCPMGALTAANLNTKGMRNTTRQVGYAWEDLAGGNFTNFMVIDGQVLDMQPYFNAVPAALPNDLVDRAIRIAMAQTRSGGRDVTRMFYTNNALRRAAPCLQQKFFAGRIDKITPGCFVSNLFLYVSLVIILGLVFVRFFMALWFSWFLSWRMSATPRDYGTDRMRHHRLPEGALSTIDAPRSAPWAGKDKPQQATGSSALNSTTAARVIGNEPYVVCLVTCYSEGEEGIANTLTSLAETDYPDSRKLLFVVADGMVTGSGETMSTPDVCVGLMEADARFGTPMPMSFVSVAQGKKMHNMAMVYAGHYTRGRGHRVPILVVVKCGTPDEASETKPGNRGKRDSQMILMNFLQRVTYNDRMTPLDFDLFRKFHALMGVTPDYFELCMMVDADTKVYPRSLRMLVNCMMRDHMIMGACGETRISNKRASWVTAIQVYEYFISHHMVKAFESVFGGVTCLPGCFSMYRIKARKPSDDDWVPVIVKPEVTREYSQSTVTTLHQKNLLLLGEDRFLTTLLLRNFPNRKMVFVPQARCRTEVPHTFKMLLSQRRRWINSTVHNLMELVLVKDLCGTFCFSMQFVVFMDLVGTAVLPIAIALTYTLIVSYCLRPPHDFTEAIPLVLLIAVLGLPAVLILLATRKVVYTLWMLVYLVFLPVWNFVLPVYAFWHFDDFGWGETRKVEGEAKNDDDHGEGGGTFKASAVPLRRWQDWELSRMRKVRREEKRRRDLELQFGSGFHNDGKGAPAQPQHHHQHEASLGGGGGDGYGGAPLQHRADGSDGFGGGFGGAHLHQYAQPRGVGGGGGGGRARFGPRDSGSAGSDKASSADPDEEFWGDIGGYREEAPPPLAIVRHSMWVGPGRGGGDDDDVVVGTDAMEAVLEKGFGEDEAESSSSGGGGGGGGGAGHVPVVRALGPSAAQARRSQYYLQDGGAIAAATANGGAPSTARPGYRLPEEYANGSVRPPPPPPLMNGQGGGGGGGGYGYSSEYAPLMRAGSGGGGGGGMGTLMGGSTSTVDVTLPSPPHYYGGGAAASSAVARPGGAPLAPFQPGVGGVGATQPGQQHARQRSLGTAAAAAAAARHEQVELQLQPSSDHALGGGGGAGEGQAHRYQPGGGYPRSGRGAGGDDGGNPFW